MEKWKSEFHLGWGFSTNNGSKVSSADLLGSCSNCPCRSAIVANFQIWKYSITKIWVCYFPRSSHTFPSPTACIFVLMGITSTRPGLYPMCPIPEQRQELSPPHTQSKIRYNRINRWEGYGNHDSVHSGYLLKRKSKLCLRLNKLNIRRKVDEFFLTRQQKSWSGKLARLR